MAQTTQKKSTSKSTETNEEEKSQETPSSESQENPETTDAELDDLLADIDDVLEENAEEFVKAYIQKGGE